MLCTPVSKNTDCHKNICCKCGRMESFMNDAQKLQVTSSLMKLFPNYNQHFHMLLSINDLDLTKTHLKALLIIANEQTMSMSELADSM